MAAGLKIDFILKTLRKLAEPGSPSWVAARWRSSTGTLPAVDLRRPALRSLIPAGTRRNAGSAFVIGAIALAGASGCGSTQKPSGHGVLAGKVTFASARGSALVRLFTARGVLLKHQAVTRAHPQFSFVVTPGQYQLILKLTGGELVGPGDANGCAQASAQVQANRTTHMVIGERCAGGS